MSVTIDITVSDSIETEADVPEPSLLQSWAAAAYLSKVPVIASLLVTSSAEIRQLNKQYRNKDEPTNVLSFPMQSPADVDISLLGDIVLCAAIIKQEASVQAKPEASHWAHMVVHGMLHLQDFDHVKNEEAEDMEQMEIAILKRLGFANPYKNPHN